MEVRRNDPCPCGSGKKYKHCCLSKESAVLIKSIFNKIHSLAPDAYFNLLVQALIDICPYAFDYMHVNPDDDWDESFLVEVGDYFSKNQMEYGLALDYMVFDMLIEDSLNPEEDIYWIELVDKEHPGYFTEQEKTIILNNSTNTNLSMFEVLDVVPGESVLLKDLFLKTEYNVIEHSASQQIQKFDILVSRIFTLNSKYYFSSAIMPVPRKDYQYILNSVKDDYKENFSKLKKMPVFLKMNSDFLIELVQECYDKNRRFNLMTTTGEEMKLCSADYKILNKENLIKKLKTVDEFNHGSEDENKDDIHFNWFGGTIDGKSSSPETNKILNISKSHFVKGKSGNVSLGRLDIKGSLLTTETNSEKRMKRLKQILQEIVPEEIKLKSEKTMSMQEAMAQYKQEKQNAKEADEIPPEIQQELITKYMEDYYKKMFTDKIPMLGNKTPKECLKTKQGKQKVLELLKDHENNELHKKSQGLPWFDIQKVYTMWGIK